MSGPRVLVVDDDAAVRHTLEAFLLDEGFEVDTAASGEEALDRLACQPTEVAVVDIRLPGMNGNELIQLAHRRYPGLRFLVYTGATEYALPSGLLEAGLQPEHLLHKPLFDMTVMSRAIVALAEPRPRGSS